MTTTFEQQEEIKRQLAKVRKAIKYSTNDYPISYLVEQNLDPGYKYLDSTQETVSHRNYKWSKLQEEQYIGSVLLDQPLTPLYLARDDKTSNDKSLIIIDGAKRIEALTNFMTNKLAFEHFLAVPALKDIRFNDLPVSEKERFNDMSLRVIVLENPSRALCNTLYCEFN